MAFAEADMPFPVQYRSDVDGDRYAIVDVADADLAGWSVEVGQDKAWLKHAGFGGWKPEPDNRTYRREFTREHAWYRSYQEGVASAWSYYKLSNDTVEYPWSVMVDHGERIIRWIPPEGQ